VNKKDLNERDICTKFITPAIDKAGWDVLTQVREEVNFTRGRVIVRGRMVKRGEPKRADYILYYKPNIPIAVIEAKDNTYGIGAGMQQALGYADTLDIPFVYSSNGDAFLEHDRTRTSGKLEREISLDAFPSPDELWQRYMQAKGIDKKAEAVGYVAQEVCSFGQRIQFANGISSNCLRPNTPRPICWRTQSERQWIT
jgi:type I restriction enzyme, R subunit